MPSPFELVSQELFSIGARTIDEFLSCGCEQLADPSVDAVDDLACNITPSVFLPSPPVSSPEISKEAPTAHAVSTHNITMTRLHQAAFKVAGRSNNVLKFEHLEKAPHTKQCFLTITRPDGAVRSYRTEPIFRRKADAKAQVANIAIEHGALDFIYNGDSDESKAIKGTLLAPLEDKQPVASASRPVQEEAAITRVEQIEVCCKEWRGDTVKPAWFYFEDPSLNVRGAALKITLAPHCYHVYSCDPTLENNYAAQEHCANLALSEGVLEFIRYGNGQTAPNPRPDAPSVVTGGQIGPQWSLQVFYESLPRPIEEDFGNRAAKDINATEWLRKVIESAKGARFTASYYPLSAMSDDPPSRIVHGCLIRLKRLGMGEGLSYLVEPQCPSGKVAKAAVALLALSLGAGKHIREVSAAVEAQITPEMRRFVTSQVLPALGNETRRINGIQPSFEHLAVNDAYGCRLQVHLRPQLQDPRDYVVPANYGSKSDAKIAVAHLAAQEGVLNLLRCGGQPPPGMESGGLPVESKKHRRIRKRNMNGNIEIQDAPQAKKLKLNSGVAAMFGLVPAVAGLQDAPQAKKLKSNDGVAARFGLGHAVAGHRNRPLGGGVQLGNASLHSQSSRSWDMPRSWDIPRPPPSRSWDMPNNAGQSSRRSASLEEGELPD